MRVYRKWVSVCLKVIQEYLAMSNLLVQFRGELTLQIIVAKRFKKVWYKLIIVHKFRYEKNERFSEEHNRPTYFVK